MTMELLTSPTPNGWKVTIMVEELREAGFELADLTVTPIDIMKGDQFTEAFTAVNPNQKIPALVDGDRNVIESCAILQYLGEKYPTSLFPQGEARWDVMPWVYWQAANVGPILATSSPTRATSPTCPTKRAPIPSNASAKRRGVYPACSIASSKGSRSSAAMRSPSRTSRSIRGCADGSGARSISPIART